MGRLSASMIVLALATTGVLGLAGCGEEDAELLRGSTAAEINSNLDRVEELADEGECAGAAAAAEEVTAQVEALQGVDRRLQRALSEGAARLNEVVAECEEETTEEVEPVIEPEEGESETTEEDERPNRRKSEGDRQQGNGEGEGEGNPDQPSQSLPPQAEGEAKGHEKGDSEAPPAETGGGESPSGGISPGAPAGGE